MLVLQYLFQFYPCVETAVILSIIVKEIFNSFNIKSKQNKQVKLISREQ
jgi:hypothetical protein